VSAGPGFNVGSSPQANLMRRKSADAMLSRMKSMKASLAFRLGLAAALGAVLVAQAAPADGQPPTPAELASLYRTEVDRRLEVPADEAQRYAQLAEQAFAAAGIVPQAAEYVAVVDRAARVQVLLLFWRSTARNWELVGASPVSTGRPGSFDHFETPAGVFEHSTANPDFRAEGTLNANGIRGYGAKGMRVYDFGWQRVPKGWGDGERIEMRLQMHATDADRLEQRLGTAQSKGCIRIPASLNRLFDHYGLLDAQYERLQREGRALWVLREDREPVADAGRYLVVVDSERAQRPDWAVPPKPAKAPARRRPPAAPRAQP
jgi:hypothetical protein